MKKNAGIFALFFLVLLVSCNKPEPINPIIPEDTPPTIIRISPTSASYTDTAGATVTMEFKLADKEGITRWKVVQYMPVDSLILNDTILGLPKEHTVVLNYIIPPYDSLTKIKLRAYVYDNGGYVDSTEYEIIVDFKRVPPVELFQLLSYTNDTIYNGMSATGKSAFNCLLRTNQTTTQASQDFKEITSTSGNFEKRFTSPNNNYDKVFVVYNTATLNWDELKYSVIDNSFKVANPMDTTQALQVGDIIILRLRYKEPGFESYNQYAVIKINAIQNTANDDEDYIVFDYKRTYKQ